MATPSNTNRILYSTVLSAEQLTRENAQGEVMGVNVSDAIISIPRKFTVSNGGILINVLSVGFDYLGDGKTVPALVSLSKDELAADPVALSHRNNSQISLNVRDIPSKLRIMQAIKEAEEAELMQAELTGEAVEPFRVITLHADIKGLALDAARTDSDRVTVKDGFLFSYGSMELKAGRSNRSSDETVRSSANATTVVERKTTLQKALEAKRAAFGITTHAPSGAGATNALPTKMELKNFLVGKGVQGVSLATATALLGAPNFADVWVDLKGCANDTEIGEILADAKITLAVA